MAILRGGVGGVTDLVRVAVPTGVIDGANVTFTTPTAYVPNSLLVFLNGLAQTPGASNDYVETSSTTFDFNVPPIVTGYGPDQILVYYQEV